jgi:hypothetical protein
MSTEAFHYPQPRLEDQWRAIILFGRNVASFKFALGKSLLEHREPSQDAVTLEATQPIRQSPSDKRTYQHAGHAHGPKQTGHRRAQLEC